MTVRWFVEAGGSTYVSGVVGTLTNAAPATYSLDSAQMAAEVWYAFDQTLDIGPVASGQIAATGSTLTLTDVAYVGYHASNDTSVFSNWRGLYTSNFEATAIPEPATMCLLGLGGLVALKRKK